LDSQFNALFQSDFFETLCSVVASRRWWLFEVSGHWLPAIVELCRIRPEEQAWKNVLKTFKEFAERNEGEDGYSETLSHLDVIRKVSGEDFNGSESDAGPSAEMKTFNEDLFKFKF